MSLSDSMFEGIPWIDDIVGLIRHYLSDATWTYKGRASGNLAEMVEADLLAVREKMVALQTMLDGESLSIEHVSTYGMPGAAEKLIAARAVVEKLTGLTVSDGFDMSPERGFPPNDVEPGHWQRLVAERGIVLADVLAWDPAPEEVDAWEATR